MKYLKQFLIILIISFIGEILKYILPFPVPASIYGMVIMFVCLISGIVKLSDVKDGSKFLLDIMPVMFIPAGVGLLSSWDVLKPMIIPVLVVTVVALVTTFGVTGRVAQRIIKLDNSKKKEKVK